jgi:hypothetical protein
MPSSAKKQKMSPSANAATGSQNIKPFSSIENHLRSMSTTQLVDVLKDTWNSEQDLRVVLTSLFADDYWVPSKDQGSMFNYDWKVENEDNFVLNFKSGSVTLGTCSAEERSLKQAAITDHYVSFELEDIGCGECSGPEIWNFVLENNPLGKSRLNIETYVECRCGDGLQNEDEEQNEDDRCGLREFLAHIKDELVTSTNGTSS